MAPPGYDGASMRRLPRVLMTLAAATALSAACGGPSQASVTGTVVGAYTCGATMCQQSIGIQSLTFRSDDSGQPTLATRSDSSGHYSIRLPAGNWTVSVGAGSLPSAVRPIHVNGFPGERISALLSIPIPIGAG